MYNPLKYRRLLWALASVLAIFGGNGAKAGSLLDVRFGPDGEKTRIVLDIDGPVEYAISGDATGEGRIFVDFVGLNIGATSRAFLAGKGHVDKYGFAVSSSSDARAVFELQKTARIKDSFMLEPKGATKHYRFVLDLETADQQAFLASLPTSYADLTAVIKKATAENADQIVVAPPPPSQKEVKAPILQPKRAVVVIDAGHGGRDPGSQGQSGTLEKTVTLAAALELKKILEATKRYDVVLTRESDKDPKMKSSQREELARREKLARDAGAELFISLHADAIAQKQVRGASVYTLSEQGTARSAKLAKSEGNYQVYGLDVREFEDENGVDEILFDLAQKETSTNSSKFAKQLLTSLQGKTPLLNRSHREGDLRVLLAPDVPAVLLEMAFISNAKDEANLNSPVWRRNAMTGVANAINAYFDDVQPQQHAANGAAAGR